VVDKIGADSGMDSRGKSNFELGADAIGA
jgi:hypothetical protein